MNKGVMIALIVVGLVIVGYVAYTQGYLGGAKDNKQDVEFNLPGSNNGGGSGY